MLRVRGKGVPRRSGGSGDLRVRLVVQLPETEDARLDEIARELEPLYGGQNPRRNLEGGS
jgi:DnaJ-class molecular chaperone